jgi:hypothetical protein
MDSIAIHYFLGKGMLQSYGLRIPNIMNGKFLYDEVRPILHCNRTFKGASS